MGQCFSYVDEKRKGNIEDVLFNLKNWIAQSSWAMTGSKKTIRSEGDLCKTGHSGGD